jgi:hypothetical protein
MPDNIIWKTILLKGEMGFEVIVTQRKKKRPSIRESIEESACRFVWQHQGSMADYLCSG